MGEYKPFHYTVAEELIQDISNFGLNLPFSNNMDVFKQEVAIGNKLLPNAFVIHPMEGCDGNTSGEPSHLTDRRYRRIAKSGAGLTWFEATAVVHEGRANPRQLMINETNKAALAQLLNNHLKTAAEKFGQNFKPFTVVQLTHSGRHSKPDGKARPIVAAKNPYLDKSDNVTVISDGELLELEDRFVAAAVLAADIGFDAVDLKCCHNYLLSDLLSAHTRPGMYGGTFENRVRFICNVIDKIKASVGGRLHIAVRMNAYDAIPYPYGWGVDRNDHHIPDLTEPKKLAQILQDKGVEILNVSAGSPYYNPHVGRPYDLGPYIPNENQLILTNTIINLAREIQAVVPKVKVVATGFSWLRQYGANVAAGCLEKQWFPLVGFGREAFAYPEFVQDILNVGYMDSKKVCIGCSKCTIIMRDGGTTGCVIRDAEMYAPVYRAGREGKGKYETGRLDEHL